MHFFKYATPPEEGTKDFDGWTALETIRKIIRDWTSTPTWPHFSDSRKDHSNQTLKPKRQFFPTRTKTISFENQNQRQTRPSTIGIIRNNNELRKKILPYNSGQNAQPKFIPRKHHVTSFHPLISIRKQWPEPQYQTARRKTNLSSLTTIRGKQHHTQQENKTTVNESLTDVQMSRNLLNKQLLKTVLYCR